MPKTRRILLLSLLGALSIPLTGVRPAAAQVPMPPGVSQSCSVYQPGTVAATFRWQAPGPGAIRQYLDLSLFNNGFSPGSFIGAGPLSGTADSLTWEGILPSLTHFYRVNVLYPDGWRSSAVGSFYSAFCPGTRAQLGAVAQGCSVLTAGTIRAVFTWTPAAAGATQWLDLSLSNNGFAPGSFVAAGPLPPGSGSYVWEGLLAGRTHYWRVNTLGPAGWASSQTGSFATGECRPPLQSCIGWLAGISPMGELDCRDIWQGNPDRDLADCIGWLAGYSGDTAAGKQACVRFAYGESNAYLSDCILGLADLSYFGATSCSIYWGS